MQIKAISKNTLKIKSPAKINLTLEIIRKRKDKYYELRSVMSEINLFDEITISCTKSKKNSIVLTSNLKQIENSKNTCYRMALLFQKKILKYPCNIKILIKKNIPLMSGLGGSSTDATAVLIGLNIICKTELTQAQMIKLNNQIGSDLNTFLKGGIIYLYGRGDKSKQISKKPIKESILLLTDKKGSSTKKVFQKFKFKKKLIKTNLSQKLIKEIQKKSKTIDLIKYCCNDLEGQSSVYPKKINQIKSILKQEGAIFSQLSGSGSTIYSIFPNNYTLIKANRNLSKNIFFKNFIINKIKA